MCSTWSINAYILEDSYYIKVRESLGKYAIRIGTELEHVSKEARDKLRALAAERGMTVSNFILQFADDIHFAEQCGQVSTSDKKGEKPKKRDYKKDPVITPSVASETSLDNLVMEAMTSEPQVIQTELEKLLERGKSLKSSTKRYGGAHDLNAKEDIATLIMLNKSDVDEMKYFIDWWFDVIRWTRAAMYHHIPVSRRLMKYYAQAHQEEMGNEYRQNLYAWVTRKRRHDAEMFGRKQGMSPIRSDGGK